jgi:N-acetylglucosaminyldiphosphoundecaprenol N-acetyl-beta-D-mannosaminyltransferase
LRDGGFAGNVPTVQLPALPVHRPVLHSSKSDGGSLGEGGSPANRPARFNVLGTAVSAVDYAQAVAVILAAAHERRPLAASALAVHALREAQMDRAFQCRLNSLDLATPDGQPVRWALNWLHATGLTDRVYGPFLMRELCAAAARERLPLFLFGGLPATLDRLQLALSARHPGLVIAGMQASRFRRITALEAAADARTISASGARLVFCGLGCPRQENWVHAMRPLLPMPLVAVGAAFALWAGERIMAPAWMQRTGLEWLYRLGQEPRRLAGRYLWHNPLFLLGLLAQKTGWRRPELPGPDAPPEYWG